VETFSTPAPDAFSILQSQSLTRLVQQEMERMITGGELLAGARLNESAIAVRLGVSRGPVREALRALEQTGLVSVAKNRGVFVRSISLAEADEIYELRAVFDQLAGRKLAATLTAQQKKALSALIDQMEQASADRDVAAYHLLNLQFHDSIVEFAGNLKMLLTYRRLVNELNLFRLHTLAQSDRLAASTREHQRIFDAIAAGDAQGAARFLLEHVTASRARVHEAQRGAGQGVARRRSKKSTATGQTKSA